MDKPKAIFYGQVTLIPGISTDGYVLENQTAVMSERGTAALLRVYHNTLQNMAKNAPPKSIEPFIDKDLSTAKNYVKVVATNCPYKGRDIVVYHSDFIENLIRAYALAFAHGALRKNQMHVGKRCVILQSALVRTALEAAIKEACGFSTAIQKTTQKNYDAIKLIQEFGFKCSANENIAIKKDIIEFLKVPQSTLNNFLYKHNEIKPIKLNSATISSMGYKARRMNGYHIRDVAKIAFGMDTTIGIDLKKKMFGDVGVITKVYPKNEIHWRKVISQIFKGFTIRFNHCIGKYRYKVDFYIAELSLCLECNGYYHRHYDLIKEQEREKIITKNYALVRFHHKISTEQLCNGIIRAKPGQVIKLYDNTNLQKAK